MTFDEIAEVCSALADVTREESAKPNHTFSWALDMLKQGRRVTRGEWKRMNVERYLTAMTYRTDVGNAITDLAEYACDMTRNPRFIADICGDYAGVWGNNLSDILANDWYEVQ